MREIKNVRKTDSIKPKKLSKLPMSPLNRENISIVFQKTNAEALKKAKSKNASQNKSI